MKTETKNLAVERLVAAGGREWEGYGRHRIYFDRKVMEKLIDLELTHYGTGNISSARLAGVPISNSRARKLLPVSFYYDCSADVFVGTGGGELGSQLADLLRKIINGQGPIIQVDDYRTMAQLEERAEKLAGEKNLTFGTYCTWKTAGARAQGRGDCSYFVHSGPKPRQRKNVDFTSSWVGSTYDQDCSAERLAALKEAVEYLEQK